MSHNDDIDDLAASADCGAVAVAGDARSAGETRESRKQRAARLLREADPDRDVIAMVARSETRDALRCLMARHGAAVYRYCREALHDAALADDVHQQVFIEAFRDLPRFAGRSTVRTWLFGIARHRVLDAVKQRRRAQTHLDDTQTADPPDPAPSPEQWLDDARLHDALRAAVAELDERIRSTLLLRYQQGLSFEEMAQTTGENPGTLQARVARALRRLRERIEHSMGHAPEPGSTRREG